jgi:hypothetical protein
MSVITRSFIPEALEVFATKVFQDEWASQQQEMIYPSICDVQTSSRAFEDVWDVSTLGNFVLKAEGAPIAYDSPVQGNRKRTAHLTWALGVRVTKEMRDDELHGTIEKTIRSLPRSARHHQEVLGHQPWNDAFTGTNYTTLDGQPLCATTHTQLKTGATWTNELNPGLALSQVALEDIATLAKLQQDDSGRYTPFTPKRVLVPTAEEFNAQRILETQYEVTTANNAINPISSSRTGARVTASPYLTDTDAWFVMDDRADGVRFWMRMKMEEDRAADFDTKDMKVSGMYRASVDTYRPEGIFGSSP